MNLTPDEKRRLFGILQNKKTEITDSHNNWKRTTNSDVLIIDGTNSYIRCWSSNPSLDENGNHTGGIVGFLKSIGYAIKLLAPSRCIIVFDGVGGSLKRRQLFPEYKKGRRNKTRLNRTYEDLSDSGSEEESCRKQYIRLTEYLQTLPVNLLSVDHVEADDVIAYLAVEQFKDSRKVFIMSSDKDFLQLCSDRIRVYSPTKKRIYGPPEVLDEYKIHPNNFVLFRAMDGDDSDNVDGIQGAGQKTVIKHFPWLNEEQLHTVDELISHATNLRNKYKVCDAISNGKIILERNVALMQLKDTSLSSTAQLHCSERMDTANIPKLDRNAFFKLVREDMIDGNLPNHVDWVNTVFDPLDRVTRAE
jgi:5'-3' exonuclease